MKLTLAFALGAFVSALSTGAMAAGDPERGKDLYSTCGACHGPQAQGMKSLNAPALAGMEPWYVVRQLKNFKSGIRGSDSKDTYGMQMAPMAQTLPDEQAMQDVAAYVESLGN